MRAHSLPRVHASVGVLVGGGGEKVKGGAGSVVERVGQRAAESPLAKDWEMKSVFRVLGGQCACQLQLLLHQRTLKRATLSQLHGRYRRFVPRQTRLQPAYYKMSGI